jgi:hypothetical protein
MIPSVVGDFLMIPLEFAGLGIERQDRSCVEIVAAPPFWIVVGRRVPSADIDRAGLLVVDTRAGAQKVDAFARCSKAVAAIPRRRLILKPFA